jgi:Domain of unknown function (DUF309)
VIAGRRSHDVAVRRRARPEQADGDASSGYPGGVADAARIFEALDLVRGGHGFEAHEVLEAMWRAAPSVERDLYQGLVHVAVATYQESRGNRVGRSRQLAKALRRLAPYAPVYDTIDIDALREWCRVSLNDEQCPPLPWARSADVTARSRPARS